MDIVLNNIFLIKQINYVLRNPLDFFRIGVEVTPLGAAFSD